jgi:hypothetical protein
VVARSCSLSESLRWGNESAGWDGAVGFLAARGRLLDWEWTDFVGLAGAPAVSRGMHDCGVTESAGVVGAASGRQCDSEVTELAGLVGALCAARGRQSKKDPTELAGLGSAFGAQGVQRNRDVTESAGLVGALCAANGRQRRADVVDPPEPASEGTGPALLSTSPSVDDMASWQWATPHRATRKRHCAI